MVQYFRLVGLALLLSVGTASLASAASFDCSKATTETEIAICNDPELSALDALADAFSHSVGLRIDLERIPIITEAISQDPLLEGLAKHFASGIEKMMGLLDKKNLKGLSNAINALPNWRADLFSNDHVLIISAKNRSLSLQDGIIIFEQIIDGFDSKPVFHRLDTHINAVSNQYAFVEGILTILFRNNRFSSRTKYRNQDDCWRAIGSEWEEFFDSGPVEEARKTSTNSLVGIRVNTLYSGQEVIENFSPSIVCLTK